MFFRCGLIEQWGRGTQKIIELCKQAGHPAPEFEEIAGSVVVTFRPAAGSFTPQVTTEVAGGVTGEVTEQVARLLPFCDIARNRRVLQQSLGLRREDNFRKAYLIPALGSGFIEMTVPDKPTSRLQKYRLTEKGRAWLSKHPSENPSSSGQS